MHTKPETRARMTLALAALAIGVAACGPAGSAVTGGAPTTKGGSPVGALGPGPLASTRSSPSHTTTARPQAARTRTARPPAHAARSTGGCTLPAVEAIIGESGSAAQAQTSGWVILQANGWTVFAPSGSWHLSASDAGADVISPDGTASANLSTWYSQTPWSWSSLAEKALAAVSGFRIVCRTPIDHAQSGQSQVIEFTGVYQGRQIHGVIALSLLYPTTPGLYTGLIRDIAAPAGQWSQAVARALWLIVKRAIQEPQQP